MLRGIIAAVVVSMAWIIVQNAWMFFRPAKARLRAMATGFFVSLPLLAVVERVLPVAVPQAESPWLGPLQALTLHTLIFLGYVECFYHVERSVTLRLLVEMLPYQASGVTIQELKGRYSQDDMIARRLSVLERSGFVRQSSAGWELTRKGFAYAAGVEALSKLFQSRSQADQE